MQKVTKSKFDYFLYLFNLQIKVTQTDFQNLHLNEQLSFYLIYFSRYIDKKKIKNLFCDFYKEVDMSINWTGDHNKG